MDYRYEAPPILRDYLIYHETIKGHSRATVDEYFLDLRNFFRFLKIERGLVPRAAELSEVSILDVDLDFVSRVTLAEVYDYLAFLSRDKAKFTRARSEEFGLNAASMAVQSASWNVDAEEVLAASDKDSLIQQAIVRDVPGTTAGDVKVTGAKAAARTEDAGAGAAPGGDGLAVSSQRRCVDVSFTVSYTCPVGPHATFTRDVSHTLVSDSKAEVG